MQVSRIIWSTKSTVGFSYYYEKGLEIEHAKTTDPVQFRNEARTPQDHGLNSHGLTAPGNEPSEQKSFLRYNETSITVSITVSISEKKRKRLSKNGHTQQSARSQ